MGQRMAISHRLHLLVLLAFFATCANAGMGSDGSLALGSNCLVGIRGARPCAPSLICLLNQVGKPDVGIPHRGICNQPNVPKCYIASSNTSWAPGVTVPRDSCRFCLCNNTGRFTCTSLPVAQCLVNPCQVTKCPAYPNATCSANYCGGCNAEFYYRGKKVDCTVKSPPPPPPRVGINGVCTIGSLTDNLRLCARGLVCVLTKQGRPEIDIPNTGTCQPRSAPKCQDPETKLWWSPSITVNKPDCNRCRCSETGLNTTKYTFTCSRPPRCTFLKDPCEGATCNGYPTAKCRLDACTSCNIEWYIGNELVKCKVIPENGACSVGSRGVIPCAPGLTCWLRRGGKPWIDVPNTGVCKDLKKVKYCPENSTGYTWAPGSVHNRLPCSSCKCPAGGGRLSCQRVLTNCLVNPCNNAKCPKYPGAQCRANYCGGCNAEFFLNGKKVGCF